MGAKRRPRRHSEISNNYRVLVQDLWGRGLVSKEVKVARVDTVCQQHSFNFDGKTGGFIDVFVTYFPYDVAHPSYRLRGGIR